MENRFERFSLAIASIHGYIQKLEREEMVRHGLRGPYAQYLAAMHRCKNGVTAAELCEICDKDRAAVSRAIGEMEQKGLITRVGKNDNFYRARICLTESGEQAALFVRERAGIAVELAGQGLSDEDRKIFYTALNLIASNLQQICRDGIPEKSFVEGECHECSDCD